MTRFRDLRRGILGAWVMASLGLPQVLIAQPDTLWTRTFGGSDTDCGYCVQETSDGGYVIVGETSSFGAGRSDIWLIKTDIDGDTLWTRVFGGTDFDCGYCIQETQDSGFIITGETRSYGAGNYDVWLIKTDPDGDTLWTKTFGGSEGDCGHCVQHTHDGGYIIVGSTESFGTDQCDVWLIRTDMNGDTLWTKTFDGFASPDVDVGYWVEEVSDSGYIIAADKGYCWSSGFWLIKTDESGDTIWTRTWEGYEQGSCGNHVEETSDSGYIVVGGVGYSLPDWSEIRLAKTDVSGDPVWARSFCKDPWKSFNVGSCVQTTADSGYVMVGSFCSSTVWDSMDIWLIKTDVNGRTMWTKTFGDTGRECGQFVRQTSHGSYIVVGSTTSFGAGGRDVWLLKVTETGVEEESRPKNQRWRLEVYPNPFVASTKVRQVTIADRNQELQERIEVYDMGGRLVEETDGSVVGKRLQTGIYFVKVEGYVPEKMVKLR